MQFEDTVWCHPGAFFPDVKWENYPDELPEKDPYAGIQYPTKWGHWKKHTWAVYHRTWRNIQADYDKRIIERLDAVYGAQDYKNAKPKTPLQRLNYCLAIHNYEGLLSSVDAIAKAAYEEGAKAERERLLPDARPSLPGRPKSKRKYTVRLNPLSIPCTEDPLLPDALALLHKRGSLTVGILCKSLRIGKERAQRLLDKLQH